MHHLSNMVSDTIVLGLQKDYSSAAIEWLLAHPAQTDNLRKAAHGNYGIILSLLGCLENGLAVKRLVDKVIDSCPCFPLYLSNYIQFGFR